MEGGGLVVFGQFVNFLCFLFGGNGIFCKFACERVVILSLILDQ